VTSLVPSGTGPTGAGSAPGLLAASPADGSGRMFDAIAGRYDRLNRILSLGVDQRWRRKTVAALELAPGARILDVATGTADLALEMVRQVPSSFVVGIDPSRAMLGVGREKVAAAGLEGSIRLEAGEAQQLPFDDDSFDGAAIAFGIRNVPDRFQGLREMARVTRPGGRVAVLELSEPRGGILAPMARFHVHTLVPLIGSLVSGSRQYRYLQQSIAAFPPAPEFARLMAGAGLNVLRVEALTFGVCHLFVAQVSGAEVPGGGS
jgi:demethylmenaquinone methyltransferase / 2-methoxy-6-polyprenyl-1,4-benzoquinol methylase